MKNPTVFIATPTFDGRIHVQYMMSCLQAVIHLKNNNINVYLVPNLSSTLLVLGRNTLVEEFLKSDATHLMCIDSDLGFNAEAITEFVKMDKDIMSGIYPSRKNQTFTYNPQCNADGSFVSDKDKPYLIKANAVPAGFMMAKREIIIKMKEHFKHLAYAPKHSGAGDTGCLLFNTEVINGEFWSEDYVFCHRACEVGAEIWIDPRLTFDHAGVMGGLQMLPEIKSFLEANK